jgi:hypothetical protein
VHASVFAMQVFVKFLKSAMSEVAFDAALYKFT